MSRADGGPAFPAYDDLAAHAAGMAASIDITDSQIREAAYIKARAAAISGMTLRDYFAAKALTGVLSTEIPGQESPASGIAKYAYELADAMLDAREVSNG